MEAWARGARHGLRAIAFVGGLWAAVSCSDQAPVTPRSIAPGHARLSIAPSFAPAPPGAPTVRLSRMRGVLVGPNGDSVKVEAVFQGDSAVLVFDVQITGNSANYKLDLTGFDANGQEAYHATETYTLKAGDNADLPTPVLVYSAPDSKVTVMHVSPASITLDAGAAGSLGVNGTGANNVAIAPIRVGWTAKDPTIATVDDNGVVHAGASQGSTYIIARTITNLADSALIKVHAPVARVVVAPAALQIVRGQSAAAAAELRDAGNHLIDDRGATWSSSDPTVATVSSSGVIQAVKIGTATITASAEGKTATTAVTVVTPVDHVEIAPGALTFASLNETQNVSVRIVPKTGANVDGITATLASTNSGVATVDASGKVTAVSNGSASIKATADGVEGTAGVTVQQVAASVQISPKTEGITFLRDTRTFSAVAKDALGSSLSGSQITFSSSDNSIAVVGATSGVATGVSRGTVTITASSGSKSDAATFTVSQLQVSISVSLGSSSIQLGGSTQARAQGSDAGGSPIAQTGATWSSSNPGVATVSATGVVRGVSIGTAQIIATSPLATASATITVTPLPGTTVGGAVTGTIVSALTSAGISGATATPTGGSPATADATGAFSLPNVANGSNLALAATGFVGTTYFGVPSGTSPLSLGALPLAPASEVSGTFSGRVIDAVTSLGVPGAQLTARSGINATTGTPVLTVTTGANGTYTATLPAGTYTISGTASGYIPASGTVVSIGGSSLSNQNIVATPVGAGNTIRIVLTWGREPDDLDSHLLLPDGAHLYYGTFENGIRRTIFDAQGNVRARLDQDVQTGNGPETITIPTQESGTYTYFVHHYAGASQISLSGTTVKVFRGSTQIAQITPPAGQGCGPNDVWSVFTLNGTTLTTTNTITCNGSFNVTSAAPRRGATSDADRIRQAAAAHPKQP